tara:strand:+ start:2107 stop:2409 length:303 start_codon:yes stop_codon:yes gene_type:complete
MTWEDILKQKIEFKIEEGERIGDPNNKRVYTAFIDDEFARSDDMIKILKLFREANLSSSSGWIGKEITIIITPFFIKDKRLYEIVKNTTLRNVKRIIEGE